MCQKATATGLLTVVITVGVAGHAPNPDSYEPPVRDYVLEHSQTQTASVSTGPRVKHLAGSSAGHSAGWANLTVHSSSATTLGP